jgi:septal ring factor EnvC (AmiA/AmiB activator)
VEVPAPVMRHRWLLIPLAVLLLQGHLFADELVQRELEGQQHRLKVLQKEITLHEKKAAQVESTKHSVLKELADLDKKIAQQWERLQSTRKKWTEKELILIDTQRDYNRQVQALKTLTILSEPCNLRQMKSCNSEKYLVLVERYGQ